MIILGLNVFHADTSACLIIDGKVVTAVEEERFTRIKHYSGFPRNSIDFCLKDSKLTIDDVDAICVNFNKDYNFNEKFKFLLKKLFTIKILTKILLSYKKNSLAKEFRRNYSINVEKKIFFIPHHLSHNASTFYLYDIDKAISLSIDGSGDFSTAEIYLIDKKKFNLITKINYPHSLGIFYQAFTQFLGFKNYGDEYKVMGLASYGKPIYYDRVKKIIKEDNNFFKLSLKYFTHNNIFIDYNFESGVPYFGDLYSENLEKLFGKPRQINDPILNFHKDLAASFQKVFEDIIIAKIQNLYETYKVDKLCLSGGCVFNSTLNGKISQKTKFKKFFLSPNPGDAGGSVGAALYFAAKKNQNIIINNSPFLGSYYSNNYVKINLVNKLKNQKFKINYFENFNYLNDKVTECLIKKEGVVGWFQDRMEWGPRALGNRSILGDPRNPEIREIINTKIKRREEFRPFAPSILDQYKEEYFYMNCSSPYMASTVVVKENYRNKIPGVVHVDGTSRVQTVKKDFNKKFFELITNFYQKTNVPVLLNTSLNVNEPICENPENAFEIFSKTSMDMLVVQNWVFEKNK